MLIYSRDKSARHRKLIQQTRRTLCEAPPFGRLDAQTDTQTDTESSRTNMSKRQMCEIFVPHCLVKTPIHGPLSPPSSSLLVPPPPPAPLFLPETIRMQSQVKYFLCLSVCLSGLNSLRCCGNGLCMRSSLGAHQGSSRLAAGFFF